MNMQKIEMIVERTETGYCAYAKKYSVYTIGNNYPELKTNIIDALNLYFEDDGIIVKENDIKTNIDIKQFFNYYKIINTQELSKRIGITQNLLTQYITGIKKPSVSQTRKILLGIQQVGKELADLPLI